MPSTRSPVRGLVDACHPGPTVTVTLAVTALAAAFGREPAGLALVAAATLAGQLSVGWCNDAHDADRDLRAGRSEKPTVRGDVTASALWRAAALAAAACLVLSYLAAGPVGGTAHVLAVASAWLYNLVLKTTVLSPLPYAVSFGLVPAYVTYGLTPSQPPPAWLTLTGVLLGVAAHLANAIPDVEADRAVEAGGLVAAVGVRRATWATLGLLVLAVALLVAQLSLAAGAAAAIGLAAAGGGLVVAVTGRGRALFRYVMALALGCVALLLLAARSTR